MSDYIRPGSIMVPPDIKIFIVQSDKISCGFEAIVGEFNPLKAYPPGKVIELSDGHKKFYRVPRPDEPFGYWFVMAYDHKLENLKTGEVSVFPAGTKFAVEPGTKIGVICGNELCLSASGEGAFSLNNDKEYVFVSSP